MPGEREELREYAGLSDGARDEQLREQRSEIERLQREHDALLQRLRREFVGSRKATDEHVKARRREVWRLEASRAAGDAMDSVVRARPAPRYHSPQSTVARREGARP